MPRISVVIPTYQSCRTIAQAIDSVLCQTYQNFEIIVIDDGSTDETSEILKTYDRRIQYYYQKNCGPSAARNNGIRRSIGEYIAFLDADDAWLPTKIEKQIALFNRDESLGLVFSDSFIVNDRGVINKTCFQVAPPISGLAYEALFVYNFIPLLTAIIRRDCLEQVGLFNESILGPEDYDLWLRISRSWKIEFINEPLAYYKVGQNHVSSNQIRMLKSVIRIKARELEQCPQLNMNKDLDLDQSYFNLFIRCSKLHLKSGQVVLAQKELAEYKRLRGITSRYLLYRCLCRIPKWLLTSLFIFWEGAYQLRMAIKDQFHIIFSTR
jgi:glycosyltransferase involved in cell wall biosynthesis